jgi:hypothetical protein
MSFFTSIGHFFSSLFGKNGETAQKVLHEVSAFVAKAEPIVEEIETVIKALAPSDKSGILAAIETFLAKYEPDLAKVVAAAAPLASLSGEALWRELAATALGFLSPASTAASVLNLAVELAYSIFKAKAASHESGQHEPVVPPAAPKAA